MALSVDSFRSYEDKLRETAPKAILDAETLANRVVDASHADTQAVWSVLWDKPLFAYTTVKGAENWCDRLHPHMAAAWQTWGRAEQFKITKTGEPKSPSFSVEGSLAASILATGIPLHRLYAIQGAANAARLRAHSLVAPFSNLPAQLDEAVRLLRGEFGYGWGPVTVLHFLTDVGLAVKPDLHLMRTMRFLSGEHAATANKQPNLRQAMAVNSAVRKLAIELYSDDTPARIRYLDKVLMEISREELIPGLTNDADASGAGLPPSGA